MDPEPFAVIPYHEGGHDQMRVFIDPPPPPEERASILEDLRRLAERAKEGEVAAYADDLAKSRGWKRIGVWDQPDHSDPLGQWVTVSFRRPRSG